MSTPVPHPAPAQAALRQAGRLGRRHGKAAAYWQIGDRSDADAQPFYHDLLRGIAGADQQVTGLYETPDLTARWDYDRDSLAADLGLARDDPSLAQAADSYLAAAHEEFWLEAERLARRRLHSGPDHRAAGGDQAGRAHPGPGAATARAEDEDEDDGAAEGADLRQDITDRASGLSRLLSERCSTCILRPGDKMHLGAEQTAAFVRRVLAEGTYVVCHQTLKYGDNPGFGPAICRGFFDAYAGRSPALRLLRAFRRLTEIEPPQPGQPPEGEGR